MRTIINHQLSFGEVDISQIQFDPKSRDDIPQILRGLQYIYTHKPTRERIFEILENEITPYSDKKNGRPGMDLWKILVMGVLRLNLNIDYDRLHELVNNHTTIRQMLGHDFFNSCDKYVLQTLKDNVKLLTAEILDKINKAIVDCGHDLMKKKEENILKTRCDSFVVETNVHFPTDINLLFDATRKVVQLTAELCNESGVHGWRQSDYNIKQIKIQLIQLQRLKHSTSKKPEKVEKKKKEIINKHKQYTEACGLLIKKAEKSIEELVKINISLLPIEEISNYIEHAKRQIDQIIRRVVNDEAIPHEEKVFSIFEPHTEWISKGKAGAPVELGLRVAIVEDECKLIIGHTVMEKTTDEEIAVPLIEETKKNYPQLNSVSFDKGFHSPENQQKLKDIVNVVALPKKGKCSKIDLQRETSEAFMSARKKHSSVESAINALEIHGLDKCPDHGIDGFKRYVSLSIVSRNIQIIGAFLIKIEQRWLQNERKDRLYAA